MSDTEKLNHYLGLEYEVRVVRQGATFHVGIPELGLHKSGKDMAAAHSELMAAKDEWLRELCAQGLYSWIVEPGGGAGGGEVSGGTVRLQTQNLKQQLTPFAIKAVVVVLLLLGVSAFLGSAISAAGRGLERDLHRIPEWSDEKVEKYRLNAQRIAKKLKPIFAEILPLVQAGQNATSTGPAQATDTVRGDAK